MFDLEVLFDVERTTSLAAGNVFRPTAADGNGELASDEVGEIIAMEVVPPVTGGGTVENLEDIRIKLDDVEHPFVTSNGTDTTLMNPPETNIIGTEPGLISTGSIIKFGEPIIDHQRSSQPLLDSTGLKFKDKVTITAETGTGGTTANFRIRLWGMRYKIDQLVPLIGNTFGGSFSIRDRRRQRTLRAFKQPIEINQVKWTQLPGGLDQQVPKINPRLIFSENDKATTANIPFQLRFDTGNVSSERRNLRFDFDRFNNAFLVTHTGINSAANMSNAFWNVDGDDFPKSKWPITQNLNPKHFGRGISPGFNPDSLVYRATPELEKPLLIWDEIGFLAITDNGTSVSANVVQASVFGKFIEMGQTPPQS